MADIPESKPTSQGQLRRVCDSSIVLPGEPEFVLDVPASGLLSKGQLRRVCDSSAVLSGEPEALDPVLLLTLRLAFDADPATAGVQTSALVDSANQFDRAYSGPGLILLPDRSGGGGRTVQLALKPFAAGDRLADADRLRRVAAAVMAGVEHVTARVA